MEKLVAQRQETVFGTLALLNDLLNVAFWVIPAFRVDVLAHSKSGQVRRSPLRKGEGLKNGTSCALETKKLMSHDVDDYRKLKNLQ